MSSPGRFYITTPIYYVNDRPHVGHVYSTTLADIRARYHRLCGQEVFFLTGTDEHAAKVVEAGAAHSMSPQAWADRNASIFQETFQSLGMSHDDFMRTSQERHKQAVTRYVELLIQSGDVYPGQYEGWYDAGQEEYVPESKAKEYGYKSPITGRDLERKAEKNYFFALSRYQKELLALVEKENPGFVQPEARRNEVLSRIREGLNDVPISRSGSGGWGIAMPGDPQQTIYVWIDALFNYLSAVDTDQRRHLWPADVHLIAKDILWFHAVIWPGLLMALRKVPGCQWMVPPRSIYSHSFWISEGKKMSKSLGNFVDLEKLQGYVRDFSLDGLRWFLATQGPLGATDADFTHARFAEVYHTDLSNTLGNCISRVTTMVQKYFGGQMPACQSPDGGDLHRFGVHKVFGPYAVSPFLATRVSDYTAYMIAGRLDRAAAEAMGIVLAVDGYIEKNQPFKLAREAVNLPAVGTILYHSAEALRIATLLLWPFMPTKMEEAWRRLGCPQYAQVLERRGKGNLTEWSRWGQTKPGAAVLASTPLFPRVERSSVEGPVTGSKDQV